MFTRPDVDRSKIHKGKKKATTKAVLYEKDEAVVEKVSLGGRVEDRKREVCG